MSCVRMRPRSHPQPKPGWSILATVASLAPFASRFDWGCSLGRVAVMTQSVTTFLHSGLTPAVALGAGGKTVGPVGSEGRTFCHPTFLEVILTVVQSKILQPPSATPTVWQADVRMQPGFRPRRAPSCWAPNPGVRGWPELPVARASHGAGGGDRETHPGIRRYR